MTFSPCSAPKRDAIRTTANCRTKSGSKRIHHRAVGDLTLDFEVVTLEGDPALRLVVFSAEPQSPSQDGLQLLSNWAATLEEGAPVTETT